MTKEYPNWSDICKADTYTTFLLFSKIYDVNNSNNYIITFDSPIEVSYIPIVTTGDNINSWITDITSNGFIVNFSANYTGKIFIAVFKKL